MNYPNITLLPSAIHPSWQGFLTSDNLDILKDIENKIGNDFTPRDKLVLRCMFLDIASFKLVILGQDPYKEIGVANGRAFQPDNLTDWHQTFRQVSLKNIVRLLYKSYNRIEDYEDIPTYKEVIKAMDSHRFNIADPQKWFSCTERQGVLWLNTTLTCRVGESNSHKEIWAEFSRRMLNYISTYNPNLIWFLWGKEAQQEEDNILKYRKLYKSRHPMMCSSKYEDDFLKSKCFLETFCEIDWLCEKV